MASMVTAHPRGKLLPNFLGVMGSVVPLLRLVASPPCSSSLWSCRGTEQPGHPSWGCVLVG